MERYGKEEKREERCRREGGKTGITQIQGEKKEGERYKSAEARKLHPDVLQELQESKKAISNF